MLAALLLVLTPATAYAQSGNIPVGGAVAYFGSLGTLPPGWVPCDGRTVDDPDSPLRGTALPDLRGLFLRGAAEAGAVGRVAGDDTLRLDPAGGHDHGGRTAPGGGGEPGRTGVAGLHRHTGQTAPAGGGFVTSGPLPGPPGGLSERGSAHQHGFDTGMSGEHSHPLPPGDGHSHGITAAPDHTHTGDNRPRHAATWFICRVK